MKNILVIYGTTTGNSETIAYFCKEILNNSFIVEVKNCIDLGNSYSFTLQFDAYILCTSTWGIDPAELQEDFEIFWNMLNKKSIKNKKYLIIGLGDDYYPFFAKAADILVEDINKEGGIVIDEPLKINDSVTDKKVVLSGYLKKNVAKI